MNDAIALVLLLIVLAACIVISRGGDMIGWIREEAYRARADTWEPGTMDDPRIASLVQKQQALSEAMRLEGRTLLAGRRYIPELTKPAEPATRPPKADRVVVPLRRKA
jgi:hypothetical protein